MKCKCSPVFTVILALLAASCHLMTPPLGNTSILTDWAYSDLRALDRADALQTEQDILAIYLRTTRVADQEFLEIRLDFLTMAMRNQPDLYLAIDHQPGGSQELPLGETGSLATTDIEWDTLLVFPANAKFQALDIQGKPRLGLALQTRQDPLQDTRIISINHSNLASGKINWQFQVFSVAPGANQISDRLEPVSMDAQPPPQSAVLLAFWNSFPAYTPAQALRRWSGAHTGPLGGSHGLAFLLRACQSYNLPLALLDLNSPTGLSALDYAGGMSLVRELAVKDLLILPVNVPNSYGSLISAPYSSPVRLLERGSRSSNQVAHNYGLPTSQFLFGYPPAGAPKGYMGVFSPFEGHLESLEPVSLYRLGQLSIIPIPSSLPAEQATLDGLSVAARQALIDTAFAVGSSPSTDHSPFLVLGGDLIQSTWGEPRRARAAFEYIQSHPWIKLLDANAIRAMTPTGSWDATAPELKESPPDILLARLSEPARGNLAQAAWQFYLALNTPVATWATQLAELRLGYLGQVNALFASSDWELAPKSIASCQEDPDLDGENECILASENVFTIIEIPEGSLVFAFVRTSTGVHQVVGPSSQLAIGLSQPETWDLRMGEQADPSVIMGAFTVEGDPYRPKIQENRLILSNQSGEKIISLTSDGLALTYRSQTPQPLSIPLILDPWERFSPGWGDRYSLEHIPGGLVWRRYGGFGVQVMSDAPIGVEAFNDTRSRMGMTENPNFDYPPGHYLPFTLALVNLAADPDMQVTISVSD